MKVRKKPSGKWEARVFDPGSRKVSAKTFRTKKEAEAWRDQQQVSVRTGTFVDPSLGRTTLAGWWDHYQQTGAWSRLRPATQETYQGLWERHVAPHLGSRQLGTIKRLDVEAWLTKLARSDVGAASANASHRVLRRVLQTAVESGVIGVNPAKGVEAPKSHREEMRFLAANDLDAIAASVHPRYRALVLTLGWTGLRIGEAAALRWENVDLLRGRLQVVEAYAEVAGRLILGPCKTEGSRRSVTLPRFLVQELQQHLDTFAPGSNGLVFTSPAGEVLRRNAWRRRVWVPALEKAGVRTPLPRIHDLRHTAVALAIQAGAHPKEIQARAGHSSITITMDRYGHLFPGQDEALAHRLDQLREDTHLVRSWSDAPEGVVDLEAKRVSHQA